MEKNGLARKQFPAEPKRRGKTSLLRSEPADLPAQLVGTPAGAEITERQAGDALDKARVSKSGLLVSAYFALSAASCGR